MSPFVSSVIERLLKLGLEYFLRKKLRREHPDWELIGYDFKVDYLSPSESSEGQPSDKRDPPTMP